MLCDGIVEAMESFEGDAIVALTAKIAKQSSKIVAQTAKIAALTAKIAKLDFTRKIGKCSSQVTIAVATIKDFEIIVIGQKTACESLKCHLEHIETRIDLENELEWLAEEDIGVTNPRPDW